MSPEECRQPRDGNSATVTTMPKYTFACPDCELLFDRTLKLASHSEHPCPLCKRLAPRQWSEQNFAASFAVPANKPTGNTGVHDLDNPTADKAVGRSAFSRWESYEGRKEVKEKARQEGGTHALIRHDDGQHTDYEPMTALGLDAHRKLAREAYSKAKKSSILPSLG